MESNGRHNLFESKLRHLIHLTHMARRQLWRVFGKADALAQQQQQQKAAWGTRRDMKPVSKAY